MDRTYNMNRAAEIMGGFFIHSNKITVRLLQELNQIIICIFYCIINHESSNNHSMNKRACHKQLTSSEIILDILHAIQYLLSSCFDWKFTWCRLSTKLLRMMVQYVELCITLLRAKYETGVTTGQSTTSRWPTKHEYWCIRMECGMMMHTIPHQLLSA